MLEFITALEDNALIQSLRFSRWAYPALNGTHILGVALLLGAIAPLDLRLAGLWRSVPIEPLLRVLRPVAATGLGIVLLTGPLLFLVDPVKYAGISLFWVKIGLVIAATVNVVLVERRLRGGNSGGSGMHILALTSLALWIAVMFCGRFIAYM